MAPAGRHEELGANPQSEPEFALTSVLYHLQRCERASGPVGSRFVAVVHERSPLAAFVALDSPLQHPQDLGGRRVAASAAPWFDLEYQAALRRLGLAPAVHLGPSPTGERASMVRGEVEAIGSWAEAIPVIRRRAEMPVRAIPFGPDIYTTGIVALDRIDADVAGRVVDAFSEAVQHQRQNPAAGLDELCRRHPTVDADAALEEWSILSGYIDAARPGLMDQARWQRTLEHLCRTHGLAPVTVEEVCRVDLVRERVGVAACG